jgi:antitoxin MazE
VKVVIKKWGNSASVRIPASVMTAARLTLDSAVDVREEDGRIIVEPIHAATYDLDHLLGAITAKNLHAEADFGEPMGKEAL